MTNYPSWNFRMLLLPGRFGEKIVNMSRLGREFFRTGGMAGVQPGGRGKVVGAMDERSSAAKSPSPSKTSRPDQLTIQPG